MGGGTQKVISANLQKLLYIADKMAQPLILEGCIRCPTKRACKCIIECYEYEIPMTIEYSLGLHSAVYFALFHNIWPPWSTREAGDAIYAEVERLVEGCIVKCCEKPGKEWEGEGSAEYLPIEKGGTRRDPGFTIRLKAVPWIQKLFGKIKGWWKLLVTRPVNWLLGIPLSKEQVSGYKQLAIFGVAIPTGLQDVRDQPKQTFLMKILGVPTIGERRKIEKKWGLAGGGFDFDYGGVMNLFGITRKGSRRSGPCSHCSGKSKGFIDTWLLK